MELNHRFPRNELLRYQQIPTFVSGEQYVIVMANLSAAGQLKPKDFALRAKPSRDGVEAYPFYEKELRKKQNDKDLYWTVTDEGDGKVSLWSQSARKYLVMDDQCAKLSRKKQLLTVTANGSLYRFSVEDKAGNTQFLRCSGRTETVSGLIFTSGTSDASSSFALLQRVYGIGVKPTGKPRLTAGTFADIHVDYGIQLFRPYLRQSAVKTAKGYARRYDLDAVIMCGDNISDNGSGATYPRGGAMQGKWEYDRWLRTRNLLHDALQRSFRNPDKKQNVFYLTGNHEYQVGDRQPEGKTYNSAYYTDLLPADILHPLIEKVDVGQGSDECLLCYEYRVNGIPFLVLNTPVYPLMPNRNTPERPQPAHTMQQANWLEDRLKEIETELGKNAVIFVSSHYPFRAGYYNNTQGCVPSNLDAYVKMDGMMNQFPNLFFFYGHVHGGNQHPTFNRTSENMEANAPVELSVEETETGLKLICQENSERGRFRSDLVMPIGYHHNYGGSMAFYHNNYFANNGVKIPSYLTHIEVPFFQGCAIEVYEDRVVLSMQNFGTKAAVKEHLPGATYNIEPLVCMLKK